MDALSSQLESVSLLRERSLSSALERLSQLDVHCVVCTLEFGDRDREDEYARLERVRETNSAVPVVAAIGSDEGGSTARERITTALESGATDVVSAADPPELVATRVRNAAERFRRDRATSDRERSILEGSDALVWVVAEDGTLEYASGATETRLGYTPDELEGTPLVRLVHPDDRERLGETIERVSSAPFGATERTTARVGRPDGRWQASELAWTNRLADPVVDGIVVTISAVGSASADDAPPDSAGASTARAAVDRLETPLFALGPEWELRYANAAASQLFGADPEPGTVVWSLLDDAVRGQFAERFREAKTTDRVVAFETDVPSLESRLAVSVHPDDDGVTVVARTVADSEPPVDRERFDLLESAVDAFADGVAVLEDETVRFANPAFYDLTDVDPIVGRNVTAVFDDDLADEIRERAASPVVRWMEPVSGTPAGSDRAVDVYVTPLSDGRTLCVVRDAGRSSTVALSTVSDSIATIRGADSPPAVRRAAIDATLAATGADLAAWCLLEDAALRPVTVESAASSAPVELPVIDRSDEAPFAELEALEALDLMFDSNSNSDADADAARSSGAVGDGVAVDRSALDGLLSRLGIRAERALVVPVGDHGLVIATSADPTAFGRRERLPVDAVAGAAATALEGLERGASLRRCRRDLERLESTVDRCDRVRTVERELLASESRDAVDQRLCDALVSLPFSAAGDAIELAWIGDVTTGSERITPDTWAGQNGTYLESISVPIDDAADADHPAARAATTLEPVVVDDLERDDGQPGSAWQRRASERGFRSVMCLPLAVDGFCYGTVTLYADRSSAFDEAVRDSCIHLVTVASYAIAAIARKRALLSDSVTELEFSLRATDDPLVAVARELGRRLDVEAVVPRSSSGATVFCTVADVDSSTLRSIVETTSALESVRVVGERGDAPVLELVVGEETIGSRLATHGGVLRSVSPADGRSRLVVDLSSTVDVRSFVRALERYRPDTTLLARRERDRSIQPTRAFDAELRRQLSERQLRTLESAYYGGFFDWPRESTGEEVADSLGVSQPTFSRHLRLAQRKVYALLFDERNGSGR